MCSVNKETDERFIVPLQSTVFCFFVRRSSPTPKSLISNIPIRQCSRQRRTSCGTTDTKNPCSSGKSLNTQGLTRAPIFIMRIRIMTTARWTSSTGSRNCWKWKSLTCWTSTTDSSMTGKAGKYGRFAKAWAWHSTNSESCTAWVPEQWNGGKAEKWGWQKGLGRG